MNYNYKITKKYMDKLEAKIKDQQDRINKAIELLEYIKDENSSYYIEYAIRDLLDILKGSNSNEGK